MNYHLSIDLGTYKFASIISTLLPNKKIKIISYSERKSMGMEHGVISEISKVSKIVKELITECINNAILNDKNVPNEFITIRVGIAGRHTKCYKSHAEYSIPKANLNHIITENDLENFLNEQYNKNVPDGERLVNIFPYKMTINHSMETFNPVGMTGNHIKGDFLIINGLESSIKNIENCFSKIGVKEINFMLEPLASSNSVLNEKEKEEGVLLLDIGGGTSDIAILKNGCIIHSAILPFGGSEITNDIKQIFDLTKDEAENIKVEFGQAIAAKDFQEYKIPISRNGVISKKISAEDLTKVILSRYYEIAQFCFYELKNNNISKHNLEKMVITGGASQQKNLDILFQYLLDMKCENGKNYLEHFENINPVLKNPSFSTLLGLVLENYKLNFYSNTSKITEDKKGINFIRNKISSLNSFKVIIKKIDQEFFN